MLRKIGNFFKNSFTNTIPILPEHFLHRLEDDKETLNQIIQTISSYVKFEQDNFFLESDNDFYNKSPHLQAQIIQNKIGLSSIYCPIKFDRGGVLNNPAGKFVQKTGYNPSFDIERETLLWERNNKPKLEIEISSKFKDNPIIIGGILSHELTHLYFHSKGLSKLFPNTQIEEKCCDLTMFILGLGKLVINSFSQDVAYQDNNRMITMTLDYYLPWYYLCYIYEKVNIINAIPEELSKSNLREGAIEKIAVIKQYRELFK